MTGVGALRQIGQTQGVSGISWDCILMARQEVDGFCLWKIFMASIALIRSLVGIHSFSSLGNPFRLMRYSMVFPLCRLSSTVAQKTVRMFACFALNHSNSDNP